MACLFTLPDSDSDSDSKPYGYIVLCRNLVWIHIRIPFLQYLYSTGIWVRVGIRVRIRQCKSALIDTRFPCTWRCDTRPALCMYSSFSKELQQCFLIKFGNIFVNLNKSLFLEKLFCLLYFCDHSKFGWGSQKIRHVFTTVHIHRKVTFGTRIKSRSSCKRVLIFNNMNAWKTGSFFHRRVSLVGCIPAFTWAGGVISPPPPPFTRWPLTHHTGMYPC